MTGKPYRPGSVFEFMDRFHERYCVRCVHETDESCTIQARMHLFEIGEPDYPPEPIIGKDGRPTCTAFEAEATA